MLSRCLLQAVKKATKPFKMLLTARKTWEKRSFQSERHMETSDVLSAVRDAEPSWHRPLRDCHISPSTSHMNAQMKAIKLENNRTRRIGAYRISQSTQNIGYMIEVAILQRTDRINHIGESRTITMSSTRFQEESIKIQTDEPKLSTI